MIARYRRKFNSDFTHKKYDELLQHLSKDLPSISFRVAETPIFIPKELAEKLVQAGEELIQFIKRPDFKDLTQGAIPDYWNVPGENDHPHFLTFDFAICKDASGTLVPKLIELQGFPSLYGFQAHLAAQFEKAYDLQKLGELSPYFGALDKTAYFKLLKEVIMGDHEAKEVVLLDLDAPNQKTAIDFYLTQRELGLKILSPTDLIQEGKQLFYLEQDEKVQVKRIYNRLIFDEIKNPEAFFNQGFDPRAELDVEWITHPNWFYRLSKYTMPYFKGEFVPETQFLLDVKELPQDLENYVLKPLFSFAGQGVIIDVTADDIYNIKDKENWILQRKVNYEPVVQALDGGVKAEIRLMYLWPDGKEPVLCINLARMSRGKMIGVRYNQDFDWVGGTVGLMEK
ncbi:hypothetical protein IWX76_003287 [Pedobacter sp. CAN_A7]|uniref:hypothetical protein n=1 Tax=Pedobacter sp. CAN_A7 TaxID=2787722 RepID=UPI0018CB160D